MSAVNNRKRQQTRTIALPPPSSSSILSVSTLLSCATLLTISFFSQRHRGRRVEEWKKASPLCAYPVCREVDSHVVSFQRAAVCRLSVVPQQRSRYDLRKRLRSPGELKSYQKDDKLESVRSFSLIFISFHSLKIENVCLQPKAFNLLTNTR